MNEQDWVDATESLEKAAEFALILSRCLAVKPQLEDWKRTADVVRGGDAANALDQARGMLERLRDQDTADLVALIDALLSELPVAWE